METDDIQKVAEYICTMLEKDDDIKCTFEEFTYGSGINLEITVLSRGTSETEISGRAELKKEIKLSWWDPAYNKPEECAISWADPNCLIDTINFFKTRIFRDSDPIFKKLMSKWMVRSYRKKVCAAMGVHDISIEIIHNEESKSEEDRLVASYVVTKPVIINKEIHLKRYRVIPPKDGGFRLDL